MSARYTSIVALLDDPRNRVCVERELRRREIAHSLKYTLNKQEFILPPWKGSNGELLYTTFRWAMYEARDTREKPSQEDTLIHIWSDPDGKWWASVQNGDEIGPFDTRIKADTETRILFVQNGWAFIDEWPWEKEDLRKWPV